MSDQAKRLEQLRAAFESGLLDEDTYRTTVAALQTEPVAAASASVVGSGAIGQAGSVVATSQGVAVGGAMFGNIYTGPPPRDDAEALAIYRRVYAASCRTLPLHGIDIEASDPAAKGKRLGLDHVYVDLNTTMSVSKKALEAGLKGDAAFLQDKRQAAERVGIVQPGGERDESIALPALLATRLNRRLVLLGDPGSGKSTFLSHLGLCLAMQGLEPGGGWLQRLPGWPAEEGDLLPVAVTLRDFARSLSAGKGKATPQQLWDFIVERLQAQNLGFAADLLSKGLEKGTVLMLLDGLDEIPTKAARSHVRNAVIAFAGRYEQARVVVTCRTLSYQDPAWQLDGVPAFELAPFTPEQINHFITTWYDELQVLQVIKSEQAAGLTRRLQGAVRRPDLRRLAPNPLLLTVMALVHTHKGRLPDARALLYEDTVDILLWRWDEIRFGDEGEAIRLRGLLQQAGRGDADLKRVLWALAFEAHKGAAGGDDSLADISEWQLQKALATLHPEGSRDWAADVIAVMKLRAGLLLERAPEVYTFPHRTFQEYLAGCHLAVQGDFAKRAAALVQDGPFWRQVILLAVGRLTEQGDTAKPLTLAAELCPNQPIAGDLGWRKVWLAGEALVEMGLNRVRDTALGQDLLARVQGRLVELLRVGVLTPVERAAAGDTLSALGDLRFRTDAWYLPDEPLLGFMAIAGGPFLMGSDKRRDKKAYDDELPQHTLDLPTFYIARYPVTVAQFQAFVEASGFRLGDADALADLPTRPVRRVSWHEALAYCDWLTTTLKTWPQTPAALAKLLAEGWRIGLPSEAQWEKAARGGDGRIFPWGDEVDPTRANYDATGIGDTSAVGSFPAGASPYGCLDMSGNVWEWTRSLWGTDWQKPEFVYPYDPADGREALDAPDSVRRVVRGGSFYNLQTLVRCAVRIVNLPGYRSGNCGFRVVLSPAQAGQTP